MQLRSNTRPVCRKAVREAIGELYRSNGYAPPRRFQWYYSPVRANLRCRTGMEKGGRYLGNEFSLASNRLDTSWFHSSTRLGEVSGAALMTDLMALRLRWLEADGQLGDNLIHRDLLEESAFRPCYGNLAPGRAVAVGSLSSSFEGKERPAMRAARRVAEACSCFMPFEEVVLVSDRPEEIHFHGLALHNEHGPALRWRDGVSAYALNGVSVPEWLVTTPAQSIDCRALLQISNVEVRREFIRKVGVERVCCALDARVVDAHGDYQLLSLDLGDGRYRPHLKMLNPSTSTYHIEGVHPGCQSVEAALRWRNGTTRAPQLLT